MVGACVRALLHQQVLILLEFGLHKHKPLDLQVLFKERHWCTSRALACIALLLSNWLACAEATGSVASVA